MNNNYSDKEWFYRKRWIGGKVRSAIKSFPCVVITGARQVGKSTFLINEFPEFSYLNLDDFSTLDQANRNPASLWASSDRIILDEVQRLPGILRAIKIETDKKNCRKKFLLSGSSNLLLMEKVTESLAGRAAYIEMLPMIYSEMNQQAGKDSVFNRLWDKDFDNKKLPVKKGVSPFPLMTKGLMPALLNRLPGEETTLWWESYITTYIERDLRAISQIESLLDFKKALDLVALRSGMLLNQSELSRVTGISQPTIHRYMALMEVSNVLRKCPPFFHSKGKRLVKAPKYYLTDPGLACHLSGYFQENELKGESFAGQIFESLMYITLLVLCANLTPKALVYFWRTRQGEEVDFIVEWGKKHFAFEIKLTAKPAFNDVINLLKFIEVFPQTIRGVLIHTGDEVTVFHPKIIAMPWWMIDSPFNTIG